MKRTKPQVFIVESLTFYDEQKERFEGRILEQMLRMGGKHPIYYYVRTKRELEAVLDIFFKTGYRYLHLSCHANSKLIATTLDKISFSELGAILGPEFHRRRLFMSACAAVNDRLAKAIIPTTGCFSVIGPRDPIRFDDAAVIWASFYHLAFRENPDAMKGPDISSILRRLIEMYRVRIQYYSISKSSKKGYRKKSLSPRK